MKRARQAVAVSTVQLRHKVGAEAASAPLLEAARSRNLLTEEET